MNIVTCGQMREIESYAIDGGISSLRLMENAGSAAARFIRETTQIHGRRCVVICGSGNNGGDGYVVARRLIDAGAYVTVLNACGEPKSSEAQEMHERLLNLSPDIISASQTGLCLNAIRSSDIIVDAVFGTGFHGAASGTPARFLEEASKSGAVVFSLDMPSGANADSGEVPGTCVKADYTITFAAPKIGQYLFPAASYCGDVVTVNIGIPSAAFTIIKDSPARLLTAGYIEKALPKRKKDSNKGTYGRVYCLCGSLGMAGASYMSACAALRSGAGLVAAGVPRAIYLPIAAKAEEIMVYPLEETDSGTLSLSNLDFLIEESKKTKAMLIGCGLSQNAETAVLVRELVKAAECTLILDADGINALNGHIDLLRESTSEIILTPHPGEMSRLCGREIAEIQRSRLETARGFAVEYGVTLVLKGANTVVAAKDGRAFINPTGNPGMAKGGSGDILAGMVSAFAAQRLAPEDAACCGVFIHGLAGDRCAQKLSQYGMVPTDILKEVPQIFREMSR